MCRFISIAERTSHVNRWFGMFRYKCFKYKSVICTKKNVVCSYPFTWWSWGSITSWCALWMSIEELERQLCKPVILSTLPSITILANRPVRKYCSSKANSIPLHTTDLKDQKLTMRQQIWILAFISCYLYIFNALLEQLAVTPSLNTRCPVVTVNRLLITQRMCMEKNTIKLKWKVSYLWSCFSRGSPWASFSTRSLKNKEADRYKDEHYIIISFRIFFWINIFINIYFYMHMLL